MNNNSSDETINKFFRIFNGVLEQAVDETNKDPQQRLQNFESLNSILTTLLHFSGSKQDEDFGLGLVPHISDVYAPKKLKKAFRSDAMSPYYAFVVSKLLEVIAPSQQKETDGVGDRDIKFAALVTLRILLIKIKKRKIIRSILPGIASHLGVKIILGDYKLGSNVIAAAVDCLTALLCLAFKSKAANDITNVSKEQQWEDLKEEMNKMYREAEQETMSQNLKGGDAQNNETENIKWMSDSSKKLHELFLRIYSISATAPLIQMSTAKVKTSLSKSAFMLLSHCSTGLKKVCR